MSDDLKKLWKDFGKKADTFFNFKDLTKDKNIFIKIAGATAETLDDNLASWLIEFVYNKCPENIKDEFVSMVEHFVSDQYEGIVKDVVDIINEYVDLPGIEEDQEAITMYLLANALLQALLAYTSKKDNTFSSKTIDLVKQLVCKPRDLVANGDGTWSLG